MRALRTRRRSLVWLAVVLAGPAHIGWIETAAAKTAPVALAAMALPPDQTGDEQVESTCKAQAEEFGKTGKALSAAIEACVDQERPSIAYWESCRTRGRDHGLKGAILRGFTRRCLDEAQ